MIPLSSSPSAADLLAVNRGIQSLDIIPCYSSEQARLSLIALGALCEANPSLMVPPGLRRKVEEIRQVLADVKNSASCIKAIQARVAAKIIDLRVIVDNPLPTKLVADYVELAHQHLDNIPFTNQEEAHLAAEALQSVLGLGALQAIPPGLQEWIEGIQDLLNNPDLYVENPKNYAQYRAIILNRVAVMAGELQDSTPEEIERRVFEQRERRNHRELFERTRKNAVSPVPNSEAHVVSSDEAYRQQIDFLSRQDRQILSRGRALYEIWQGRRELQEVNEEFSRDREIVLLAVQRFGGALQYAVEELRNDREVVLTAVQSWGVALEYASESLKNDKEVVLAAIWLWGRALEYASEALKGDREVVVAAVQAWGPALQFAGDGMKNDKEAVLTAVRESGSALQFAGGDMKNDKEVVLAAVREWGDALQFASEALKNDEEVVLAASAHHAPREFTRERLRH